MIETKPIINYLDSLFSKNNYINERYISLKIKAGKVKRAVEDEIKRHYYKKYDIDKLNSKVKILKRGIDSNYDWRYKNPLISIIITTYNRMDILKQAIKSIEKFTRYPNYELIIVDDCSTERGMKRYLVSLGKIFPRYRVLFNKRNMGFAKTNNRGIRVAKGKYVCLFNADLIATEYWLSELVKLIQSRDEIKIVGSKLLYPWNGKIQHAGVSFTKCHWPEVSGKYMLPYNIYQSEDMDYIETMQVKEYPAMGFSCALIEKEALKEIGLLPIGYEFGGYDDIETCMLMIKRGHKFFFCPTSVLYHYETLGMVQHRHYRKNERKKAIYFIKKWSRDLGDVKEKDEFIYNNAVLNKKEFNEKKSILKSFPQTLHIEASSLCNLKCIMCSQRWLKEKKGNLKGFKKLVPYLKYAESVSLSGNGEPFVNKNILDYVKRIKSSSKAEIVITTNGILLDRFLENKSFYKIDALVISIDGANAKTYNSIRVNADFNKLIRNIKRIEDKKKKLNLLKPKLYFEFVAMKRNIKELPSLVELAKNLGIYSVTVVYLNVHNKSLLKESLFYHKKLANEVFDIAKKKAEQLDVPLDLPLSFGEPKKGSRSCLDPWKFFYVRWNGEVRPCCGGLLPVGNLKKQSFDEIWNGQEMQVLRKSMLNNKLQMACKECHDVKAIFDPDKEESHVQLL